MNPLTPGELTVRQILAAFDGITTVRRMAADGACEREIGEALEWRLEDVREAARIQGFQVSAHPIRQALCPRCGHLLMPDASCSVCALRLRLERLHAVNAEEHRREVERLEDAIDATKQDTCRTRRRQGTNPRTGARE